MNKDNFNNKLGRVKETDVLLEREYLEVKYYPENQFSLVTWFRPVKDDVYMDVLDEIFLLLEKYVNKGVVADVRFLKIISSQAMEYTAKKYKNFKSKNSLFKQAMVVEDDIFVQFGMENLNTKLNRLDPETLETTRYFKSLEKAVEWIIE